MIQVLKIIAWYTNLDNYCDECFWQGHSMIVPHSLQLSEKEFAQRVDIKIYILLKSNFNTIIYTCNVLVQEEEVSQEDLKKQRKFIKQNKSTIHTRVTQKQENKRNSVHNTQTTPDNE